MGREIPASKELNSALLYPARVRNIILGIPGPWTDLNTLGDSINAQKKGYVVAANILSHPETKKSFVINSHNFEELMNRAFHEMARVPISEEEFEEIGRSKTCVFIESPSGSISDARDMLEIGKFLLDCGGSGIRVESSGISYSAQQWQNFAASEDLLDLYKIFVRPVTRDGFTSSFGMLNFGLPDCIVSATILKPERQLLIDSFNFFQVAESPELESQGTFGVSESSTKYTMTLNSDSRYRPSHPFHNPFGIWYLWTEEILEKLAEEREALG